MIWRVLAVMVTLVGIGGIFYAVAINNPINQEPVQQACTLEARICPDGSAVGREGPNCEFAACPIVATTTPSTQAVSAGIDQTVTVNGVTITLLKIVSDSRCPSDPQVQCVWAGTVELKIHAETSATSSDMVVNLGTAVQIGAHQVKLITVSPQKLADKEILPVDYQFTFEVTN